MKLIYLIYIILTLLILFGIYVYFNIKDTLTEGFQIIDNKIDSIVNSKDFDPTNFDYAGFMKENLSKNTTDISNSDISNTDISNTIINQLTTKFNVDVSNINVNELVNKISNINIDVSTVDKRGVDDLNRRCEQYSADLLDKMNKRDHYMITGNFSTVRANDSIINGLIKVMSDLGC